MKRHAYTLFELIVVTLILTVILSVAIGSFGAWHYESSPDIFAEKFRREAAFSRRRAIAAGRSITVKFLAEKRKFEFVTAQLSVPAGLAVKYNGNLLESETMVCRFFPDGSAKRAMFEFIGPNESSVQLRISPLTGFAEIVNEQEP